MNECQLLTIRFSYRFDIRGYLKPRHASVSRAARPRRARNHGARILDPVHAISEYPRKRVLLDYADVFPGSFLGIENANYAMRDDRYKLLRHEGREEFYDLDQDGRGVFETRWFWRLRAANGKIIADCAEGYEIGRAHV